MISRTSMTISKAFYQVVMLSFIGIVMWVGWSIYQAIIVPPKIQVNPELLQPVVGELDDAVSDKLTTRLQLSETIDELTIQNIAPTIIASGSAHATTSGTLR